MSQFSAIERLASDVRTYESSFKKQPNAQIHEYVIGGENHMLIIYYRKDLSQRDYTRRYAYDVLSTIDSWGKLRKAIVDCLRFDGIDYGLYSHINETNPSLENYLKPHYKYEPAQIEGLEDGTVMRFTEIYPYDD